MSGDSWWSISGETAGERIRDGLPQLVLISVIAWGGALVSYNLLAYALDPITASVAVLVGGLAVGLKLRAWLVGDAETGSDDVEHTGDTGIDSVESER